MRPLTLVEELVRAARSCFAIVIVFTVEVERVLRAVQVVCRNLKRHGFAFDVAEGFSALTGGNGFPPRLTDPMAALAHIETAPGKALYVLKDATEWWNNPQPKMKLCNMGRRLVFSPKCLILLCPDRSKLPAEFKDLAHLVELPPPSTDELDAVLAQFEKSPGIEIGLLAEQRAQLLQAALGLSLTQFRRVCSMILTEEGALDDSAIARVAAERAQLLGHSQALQFCQATKSFADIGGLELLKEWLEQRRAGITAEGHAFGLPVPKGVLLLGVPGTGKSLIAKAIAAQWQLLLLRLDVGALFGSLVGQSEAMMREAMRCAEASAPCVLWVEEIEKAFSGTRSSGFSDGGTTSRVFGEFLTWMAEKTAAVFVVATANEIADLPLELVRKGRFDEVFFLDLPTCAERTDIFKVLLASRELNLRSFDLKKLAQASEGFVGSELEAAVNEALYCGFNAGQRQPTTNDILHALASQKPLSRSHAEQTANLRRWVLEGRARPASIPEKHEAGPDYIPLEPKVP
jgi:hypothetical protein